MESSSHNSSKRSLDVHEEDANVKNFRRRSKIIILILVLLIISLTLTLAALIFYLVRLDNSDSPSRDKPAVNPALEAFCHVNSDAPACLRTVNPIISYKFVSDPNQIFALSLQAAAEDLQRSIASLTDHTDKLALNNCSNSLRDGLDQIRYPLSTMRVDPFVESKSDEQREEMMNRIVAAEEDVDACLDDLEKIGVHGGVTAELVKVKAYLNGAGDFLIGYAEALQMFEADSGAEGRGIFVNHVFGICMCVSQVMFIICLFFSLFRIKSRRKF